MNSVVVLPGVEDDAFAEQGESGAAVHLAFEHLDPVDVAFDLAGAIGQGQAVEDGLVVAVEPGDEGAQVRLVVGAGPGDPGVQLLPVPAGEDWKASPFPDCGNCILLSRYLRFQELVADLLRRPVPVR